MRNILFCLFMLLSFSTKAQLSDSLQVYPNPFIDSANIRFGLAYTSRVTLKVYNKWGQIVETFYDNTILPTGIYKEFLYGNNLNDGVYFVNLKVGANISSMQKVIKTSKVSISESQMNDLLLYPNPVDDFIQLPIKGEKTIKIIDINGRIIFEVKTTEYQLNLSTLQSGEYTIIVEVNDNIFQQKLMKQ